MKLLRILKGVKLWDLNLIYFSGLLGRDLIWFKVDLKKMKKIELVVFGIFVLE